MTQNGSVQFGRKQLILLIIAVLLVALSWWRVLEARSGLVTQSLERDGVPMLFMAPAAADNMPGVLIAHGFGGSKQLMLAYGHVLARAGYGVMLWDFDGHAANPAPLDEEADRLQRNLDAAYAELVAQPQIDNGRIALLGHSMGSGAVMAAGIQDPERYQATVAISPTGADVTPALPRNLLLQAGAWESRFVANARALLATAGGENSNFDDGQARAFVLVPAAEHITILFNPASHQAALDWLNRTFGTPRQSEYVDRRIFWYVAHLVGWLLLITAVSPLLPSSPPAAAKKTKRSPWHRRGLLLAPFLAAVLLALLGRLLDLSTLGGVVVGGALGVWFLAMGLLWWGMGFRPSSPALRDLAWGIVLFAFLWVAVGALAQFVWLPWFLIPARLVRWPLLALACLPWLLAAGIAQQGAGTAARAGWWLAQSVFISAALLLAVMLVPSLFVLVLVLPLLPVLFAIMAIAGAAVDRPWAYAIGNALFFSWLLLAYFPLSG